MIKVKECKACGVEFTATTHNRVYCDFCSRHDHRTNSRNRRYEGVGDTCETRSLDTRLRFGFELLKGEGGKYGDAEDE
jgi:hypothetical protein